MTANLRNTSSQALDVTVTASNGSTGNQSSVQMMIDPNSTADLSTTGLIIEHGDDVAITSPPYVGRQMHAN